MSSTSSTRDVVLVCACEVIGIENALVVSSGRWASGSAPEKYDVFVVGVLLGFALLRWAGLGSLRRFRCHRRAFFGSGRFNLALVQSQVVLVFAVLASNSISELLQALGPYTELLRDSLLGRVVGKKNERLKRCIGVALLVDAPENMVEKRLEIGGDSALG
jgi:hypothetical protein